MYFDFRPLFRRTFAELSRKYPYSQTPAISRGGALKEKRTPGALVAMPHFWKLGCCMWSLFLETSKSTIRQWQRQVQGCASGPWCLGREASPLEARLLPTKGKVIVQKHRHTGNWTRTKPKFSGALLLPDPGRRWVTALYILNIISNFRETFAEKNVTFAN